MKLSEFFNLPDKDPVFHWSQDGDVARITNFVLPPEDRGRGLGTKLYREWEAKLPTKIKRVELRAKNEQAKRFWASVGFKVTIDSDEGAAQMTKNLG